jgi:hypothetical protein
MSECRTEIVSVWLEPPLRHYVEQRAKRERRTLSATVAMLVAAGGVAMIEALEVPLVAVKGEVGRLLHADRRDRRQHYPSKRPPRPATLASDRFTILKAAG